MKNGDIDFGLALESEVPGDLNTLRWKEVETVVMTPAGHPLAETGGVTLKQIAKYPLILPPASPRYRCRRTLLEERFRKLGIDYHIVMESSNVELSSLYVEMGLGISFATVVMDLPILKKRKLRFIPLGQVFTPDHIAVVMRKGKMLAAHKRAFINKLFGQPVFAHK